MPETNEERTTKFPVDSEGRYLVSPEESGNWWCLKCLNKTSFIGVDHRGYGGPEACANPGDCPNTQFADCCGCVTVLRQPFTVEYDAGGNGFEIVHGLFTGGSDDAEIGTYTQIICGECKNVLWLDPTLTDEELGRDTPGADFVRDVLEAADAQPEVNEYEITVHFCVFAKDAASAADILEGQIDGGIDDAFVPSYRMMDEDTRLITLNEKNNGTEVKRGE